MTTDFEMKFGASNRSNVRANGAGKGQPEEKAEFWLNIGYMAKGAGPEGQDMFVALQLGLPLDTMKPLKTNSSNAEYAEFNAARNDLWEQVMGACAHLKPGEDMIINPDAALQIQIRRVREETTVATTEGANKFVRKLAFV